jgi:L-ascorbate oxidase
MNASSDNNPKDISDDQASVWMLRNGSATQNSAVLDAQILSPFEGNSPVSGPADVTHSLTINQTDVVTWAMDGATYQEADIPIVYGNVSDGWQANTTIHMPSNSTIDIIMSIANDSMDLVSRP